MLRLRCAGLFSALCPVILLAASAPSSWIDVPFVQQVKAGCGSAAIAMVVQYWARSFPGLDIAGADSERINQLLPPDDPKGIRGQALKEFLDQHGFAAFVFTGTLEDLRHHFEKGRPVVVCIAPGGVHAPLHYAVVVGLDDDSIWMNDPARGKLFHEDLRHFSHEWKVTSNWGLLAVPRRAQ